MINLLNSILTKYLFTIILLTATATSYSQQISFEDWQKEAQWNTRLLPKYGEIKKSKEQKKADKQFIAEMKKQYKSKTKASNQLINIGFQYLYSGDLKTAMYRFNQAYLLDKNNSNIYWGYGAIYNTFRRYNLAREQYENGLLLDKNNDNILIDYGTTYLGEYYHLSETNDNLANQALKQAKLRLSQAYSLNPDNPNSSYKLSICYFLQDSCEKASAYLEIAEKIGTTNISESYKSELKEKCDRSEISCQNFRTGKFKLSDEITGVTLIERTETYQIEENQKYGYKIKLEIIWVDDCTYQLKFLEDLNNPESNQLPLILTCKIIEVTTNGYIQISSSDIDPKELKAELIKID